MKRRKETYGKGALRTLLVAAVAAAWVACTQEEGFAPQGTDGGVIALRTAGVTAMTRSVVASGVPEKLAALAPIGTETAGSWSYASYEGKVFGEQTVTFEGNKSVTHTPPLAYPTAGRAAIAGLHPATGWTLAGDGVTATLTADGKTDVMTAAPRIHEHGTETEELTFRHGLSLLEIYAVAADEEAAKAFGGITSLRLFTHKKNGSENAYYAKTRVTTSLAPDTGGTVSLDESGSTTVATGLALWSKEDKEMTSATLSTTSVYAYCLAPPVTPGTKDTKTADGGTQGYWLEVGTQNKDTHYVAVDLRGADGKPFTGSTAGRRFDITLLFGDRTVTATCKTSAWTESSETHAAVISREIVSIYQPTELKLGDYFYSDGTYSDGGTRVFYIDRSGVGTTRYDQYNVAVANPKPAPDPEKTVVGVVCGTDPSRVGDAEKEALVKDKAQWDNYTFATVMASKMAGTQYTYASGTRKDGLTALKSKAAIHGDISGLANWNTAYNASTNNRNDPATRLPAYNYARNVHEPKEIPNTTGWYLPASGQVWDILQNLAHCPKLADPAEYRDDMDLAVLVPDKEALVIQWTNQGSSFESLNGWLSLIPDDQCTRIGGKGYLWCSSRTEIRTTSERRGLRWSITNDGVVECRSGDNSIKNGVRPVLVFAEQKKK